MLFVISGHAKILDHHGPGAIVASASLGGRRPSGIDNRRKSSENLAYAVADQEDDEEGGDTDEAEEEDSHSGNTSSSLGPGDVFGELALFPDEVGMSTYLYRLLAVRTQCIDFAYLF